MLRNRKRLSRDQVVHQPFARRGATAGAAPLGIVTIAEETDHRLATCRAGPVCARAHRPAQDKHGPSQMFADGLCHPLESNHALAPISIGTAYT